MFNAETGEMGYHSAEVTAENLQSMPILPDILDACEEYNPDTQVVLMAKIVFARGFRGEPESLLATLTVPQGGIPPVAAWAMVGARRN